MSTISNVSGEPAFMANKKALASNSTKSLQRNLSNCCYSSSNLIIIFACIIGLYFTISFINDEPLYEYGEHLLTLRFYRQLIYIIVVFPLIFLVPLFNAASACLPSSRPRGQTLGQPSLIAKIAYQVLVALLAFVALIFVAPSIRYSSLVKQIDWEFKRHMKFRYEKDFSYVFLDRIQQEYDCCDDDWYRANYNDKIPMSCYTDDLEFSQLRRQTCPEAIGWLVSFRCIIISASLLAILVALAFLIASDALKLLAVKQDYDVRAREQTLIARASSSSNNGADNHPPNLPVAGATSNSRRHIVGDAEDDDDDDDDGGFRERNNQRLQQQQQQLSDLNRLRLDERRRERPLLTNGRTTPLAEPHLEDDDDERNFRAGPSAGACLPPTILARASYVSRPPQTRPKSPVFVGASRSSSPDAAGGSSSPASPRSVLKKSGSVSRSMDRSDSWSGIRAADDDEFESYQRQLQQSLQTQRPLFNVRFAE